MTSGRMGSTGTVTLDRSECRSGRPRPLVIAVARVAAIPILVLHGSGDCDGDVVVVDMLEVIDTSWTLSENVTVKAGGTLLVAGSAITFLSESPLQYGIVVEAGGQLVVTDLDDDPSTTSDRSVLDGNVNFFDTFRYLPQLSAGSGWSGDFTCDGNVNFFDTFQYLPALSGGVNLPVKVDALDGTATIVCP